MAKLKFQNFQSATFLLYIFSGFFDDHKVQKKWYLFETEIFCDIINVIITVTFDQFNASLKKYWVVSTQLWVKYGLTQLINKW